MALNSASNLPSKRDRSQAAAQRKARQRQRERESGSVRIEISVSQETASHLQEVARLGEGDIKAVASMLVRLTAARHRADMEELTRNAAALWKQASVYRPYVRFLTIPGTQFRIKDQVLRYEDWEPICRQLGEISTSLMRKGWSKVRIERFFATAASKLKAKV
jgi:hypothetical protein